MPTARKKVTKKSHGPTVTTEAEPAQQNLAATQIKVVCFAKMIDDKEEGIYLGGVFFGGAAVDQHGAEAVARDCVNTIRGGTIIPRIYDVTERHQLPRIMQLARTRFLAMERQMMDTEETINHTRRK